MNKLHLPKGVKQKIMAASSVIIGAKKEVDAVVFGLLAIHPQGDMPNPEYPYKTKTTAYKITHIPSGKRIVTLYQFAYARKAVQLLSVGFDWSFRDISELSLEDMNSLMLLLTTLRTACFVTPRAIRKKAQEHALEIVEMAIKARLEGAQDVLPFNS